MPARPEEGTIPGSSAAGTPKTENSAGSHFARVQVHKHGAEALKSAHIEMYEAQAKPGMIEGVKARIKGLMAK